MPPSPRRRCKHSSRACELNAHFLIQTLSESSGDMLFSLGTFCGHSDSLLVLLIALRNGKVDWGLNFVIFLLIEKSCFGQYEN